MTCYLYGTDGVRLIARRHGATLYLLPKFDEARRPANLLRAAGVQVAAGLLLPAAAAADGPGT